MKRASLFLVLLILSLINLPIFGQSPHGAEFIQQSLFKQSGAVVNATADSKFRVFGLASDGAHIESTQTHLVMATGLFELVGGFWPAAEAVCHCLGNIHGDLPRERKRIQQFVRCLVVSGAGNCAELDGVPGVDLSDVGVFVENILAGTACP